MTASSGGSHMGGGSGMSRRADNRNGGGEDGATYRTTLEAALGIPLTGGNSVRVLRNGVEIFPAMLAAIRGARQSIEFLTFVYWTGDITVKFATALAERASAGVSVRIILDAIGAAPMDRSLVRLMQNA